jgi:hypothetical protein
MDNGLKYRDLQLLIDNRICELADQIYDEQCDKNYSEITEDQVIELVKSEFTNDQDLEDLLQLGNSIMMSWGRTEDIKKTRDHFYYTTALKIMNAIERRYTGYRANNNEYCSSIRHPKIYSGLQRL